MKNPLLFKTVVIGVLMLLILIPLGMIGSTINERMSYREEAVQSILASYAGTQTVVGPVLVVPYQEIVSVNRSVQSDEAGDRQIYQTIEKNLLIFPETLHMLGQLKPEKRYRGIHQILVYEMDSQLTGTLSLPDLDRLERSVNHVRFEIGKPYLSFSVSDPRGLLNVPTLSVNEKTLSFSQHTNADFSGRRMPSLKADIVFEEYEQKEIRFSLNLVLAGTQAVSVVPLGKDNEIRMISVWGHPKFSGTFLPRTRTVNDQGFEASWNINAFNTQARSQLKSAAEPDVITVELIEPVNIYLQTERATKYGFLFVLLTFVGFFIFELLKKLRIHPVQYLLVGLGLVIFFLLLLALSEHVTFFVAYLVASTACIGLLGFYLSYVLQSPLRGISFACLLTGLYGALYGLLLSEDNALILGACMLFVILAVIMVLTRRIDWYTVNPVRDV